MTYTFPRLPPAVRALGFIARRSAVPFRSSTAHPSFTQELFIFFRLHPRICRYVSTGSWLQALRTNETLLLANAFTVIRLPRQGGWGVARLAVDIMSRLLVVRTSGKNGAGEANIGVYPRALSSREKTPGERLPRKDFSGKKWTR